MVLEQALRRYSVHNGSVKVSASRFYPAAVSSDKYSLWQLFPLYIFLPYDVHSSAIKVCLKLCDFLLVLPFDFLFFTWVFGETASS